MKILIDDGNINNIKALYEYYPVEGVTTNPSILAKTGKNPYIVLEEIRSFIGGDELHVQVLSTAAEGIIKEAEAITGRLGLDTFIKIPCDKEGFKAMKYLAKAGYNITATVVYTPLQALLAAKCGARYVAPYINRIDNMGYDGVTVAKKIQNMFDAGGYQTKILGASFKNSQQVIELAEYGIEAVTCSADVIENFIKNPAIEQAIKDFRNDFEKVNGAGNKMNNL